MDADDRDQTKGASPYRVEGSMVVATVILLSSVCIAPGNSRLPSDADLLKPELAVDCYLCRIRNDARVPQCHSPRRAGELAVVLSFDDELLESVETM